MILGAISKLLGGAGNIIDNLHTSDEERMKAKAALLGLQSGVITEALAYEKELAQAKAAIITAEASSANFLTSSWRPITMLFFVFLVGAHWFGFTPENLSEAEVMSVLQLVKIGLGGYVVGRSVEKVIPATAQALKAREET